MPTLVGRDSRPNCVLEKELRRYERRSRFPKKPPFRAHFRAFYPHPAHKSSLRAEWATHFLAPGKRGWSPPSPWPPFSRLTPHAPRQTSGVRTCADPPPLAYYLTPTPELAKTERDPISTSGSSSRLYSLCHRTGRFLRTNQTFAGIRPSSQAWCSRNSRIEGLILRSSSLD